MNLIKPKGLLIGKKKFQLVGPNGKKSKEINLKQKSKKQLDYSSKLAIANGLIAVDWKYIGSPKCIYLGHYKAINSRKRFIGLLKKNKSKNKDVLIIGPALGYEAPYIQSKINKVKIDTFDIINSINPAYKGYIENKFIDKGGIENYENKDLIGKYDGITAVFSAGWHTKYPERNIVKIATMLKPGGVAVILTKENLSVSYLKKIFNLFKLDNLFEIEIQESDIIIKRK